MENNNTYGLVVGVSAYQFINPLPVTVTKDASDVHAVLVNPKYCAFPEDNVRLLLNDNANKENILNVLSHIADQCDSDSTVFIYFSGHGLWLPHGENQGTYLLPVDVSYQSEADLVSSSIPNSVFIAALQAIVARKVVVIFDACHSGSLGETKGLAKSDIKSGLPQWYYDELSTGRGRIIIASSRENEESWVFKSDDNSLFTLHLLNGLQGHAASEDGYVRIFNLFEYLQPRVTIRQPIQHPIFSGKLESNFPLAFSENFKVLAVEKAASEERILDDGYEYDAYISYLDKEPDSSWVWDTLVPRLKDAGLKVAVSGNVGTRGVARLVNDERGMEKSRRTLVILSDDYLQDFAVGFENTMAQTMGIQEGFYRVIPIYNGTVDKQHLPTRLGMLSNIDLAHPRRAEEEMQHLISSLKNPLN